MEQTLAAQSPSWHDSAQDELMMDVDEPAVCDSADDEGADTDREHADAIAGGSSRLVVNSPPKQRKISERRRADNAAFDAWIEQNQHHLSRGRSKLIVDDDKSLQALVRDFKNKRIITSPRDYQLELFERAKTQNTIAVLDTGVLTSYLLSSCCPLRITS